MVITGTDVAEIGSEETDERTGSPINNDRSEDSRPEREVAGNKKSLGFPLMNRPEYEAVKFHKVVSHRTTVLGPPNQ